MNAKKREKLTFKQKQLLIESVKKHPKLIQGKYSNEFTHKNAETLWKEISVNLNSLPGAQKSWDQWRKCWQDISSRTKLAVAKNRNSARKTGGGDGSSDTEDLPPLSDEILSLIKPVAVQGHTEVLESTTDFEFSATEQTLNNSVEIEDPKENNDNDNLGNINENTIKKSQEKTSKIIVKNKKHHNLVNSAAASEAYQKSLDKKIALKENYYKRKSRHFDTMEDLELRKVKALEKIAEKV